MLGAITLLLVYQTIGDAIALVFKHPVPDPVIGILLLFITLIVRGSVSASLRETAHCYPARGVHAQTSEQGDAGNTGHTRADR
jgi:hypothetical protein